MAGMWQTIETVPADRDLELAVIDKDGTHALVFACRCADDGWIDAVTGELIPVHPDALARLAGRRDSRLAAAAAGTSASPGGLLIQVKAGRLRRAHMTSMWQTIETVPTDRDLELAVIDKDGTHALVFACRHANGQWFNAETGEMIPVHPTHWREWREGADRAAG